MSYRYESLEDGQVIESEQKLDHLDGLARWSRTEVHGSPAPAAKPAASKPATGGRKSKAEKDAEAAAAKAAAEQEAAAKAAAEAAKSGDGENESTGGADERPADDADLDVWKAYALNHGKTEAELDDLSRDDIAELFPAAE